MTELEEGFVVFGEGWAGVVVGAGEDEALGAALAEGVEEEVFGVDSG